MKRHEALAAIAAAAGLTLATSASAGGIASVGPAKALVTLQEQVGEGSDQALSQMIQLAKGKGNKGSKSQGLAHSHNEKAFGGRDHKGKHKGHAPS